MIAIPPDLRDALQRMGLLHGAATGTPLAGGVSSDIWRVDLPAGAICAKRALAKLRVAVDWRAPTVRNRYEARWMRHAAAAVPGAVPDLLGQDEASGTLAMAYLDPADHPLWKDQLRAGQADPVFAASVGAALGRIHAAAAATPALAAEFPTDDIFRAIRVEPYLLATGQSHPDLAARLGELAATTLATKRTLVHGDVSPKNILAGPAGPIFLDAECAWWGDPAFDLAFALNHLLLKCLWVPSSTHSFLACFDALAAAYRAGVVWEPAADLEARTAHLLPGLFLARVDGKSPVEYVTDTESKAHVRLVARTFLANPVTRLADIRAAWAEELAR